MESLAHALERDSAWLHRLARALTRDVEEAADAAQTTLLAAWEKAPEGRPPKRAWLARVLVNALSEGARRRALGRSKETEVARAEASEPGDSPLERLELQRRVVDAVEALEEPYRGTLVLRFFDGLSPRAIAARQGIPKKTVYTRIERGLAKLRAQLDSRFGDDRKAWVSALVALPAPDWTWWSWWSWTSILRGVGAMGTGVKLGAGAVALVVVAAMVWMKDDGAEPADAVAAPPEVASATEAATPLRSEPAEVQREVVEATSAAATATPEAPAPEAAPPAEGSIRITGRVLDVHGDPLPRVNVLVQPWSRGNDRHTRADEGGRFSVDVESSILPVGLMLDDEHYASVREGYVQSSATNREAVVVGARAGRLEGVTFDEHGRPLEDVALSLVYDDGLLVDFPFALDSTSRVRPMTTSDVEGHFGFEDVPVPEGCELLAQRRGYEPQRIPIEDPHANDLEIQLRSLTAAERDPEAEGTVLLPDGKPAVGATVRYGSSETKTTFDGSFQLPLPHNPDSDLQLAAGMKGYGTTMIEWYGELQQEAAPYAPAPVTLVLREESLGIAGRVVGPTGEGLAGWNVRLEGATALTRWRTPAVVAEAMFGEAYRVTDEEGHFEIDGLFDRDYEVMAYDPKTLMSVGSGPVAAGTEDLLLVADSSDNHPRIRGRVVSRRGDPVAKARVSLGLVTHKTDFGQSWVSREIVHTDEDGRWEMSDVPPHAVHLNVGGDDLVPDQFPLDPELDPNDIELEVALRCHFRVTVTGPDLANLWVEALDAEGQRQTISAYSARGSTGYTLRQLTEGKMEVAAISEDAVEIVLKQGIAPNQVEIARKDLPLLPGEVSEVRFELD